MQFQTKEGCKYKVDKTLGGGGEYFHISTDRDESF